MGSDVISEISISKSIPGYSFAHGKINSLSSSLRSLVDYLAISDKSKDSNYSLPIVRSNQWELNNSSRNESNEYSQEST